MKISTHAAVALLSVAALAASPVMATPAAPAAHPSAAAKPVAAHAAAKPVAKPAAKPSGWGSIFGGSKAAPAATHRTGGRMVTARLSNGKTVTYDCSLAGNKTKTACK